MMSRCACKIIIAWTPDEWVFFFHRHIIDNSTSTSKVIYACYLQLIIANYKWLDPYLGYVDSLTRRLDAAIKYTKNYYANRFLSCDLPYPGGGVCLRYGYLVASCVDLGRMSRSGRDNF